VKHRQKSVADNPRPPRWGLVAVLSAALAPVLAVGVWGLAGAPKPPPPPATTGAADAGVTPTPPATGPATMADPAGFAAWAASALFDWDTATMNRADVAARVMAAADPGGDGEADGLASDVDGYLPDQATWAALRRYATRQTLTIDHMAVPDGWAAATTQAQPGQLLPGTLAYTVTGTRHRQGTWNGQPETYQAPVAFTMFIACQPAFPTCHLLRLSMPGQPLN